VSARLKRAADSPPTELLGAVGVVVRPHEQPAGEELAESHRAYRLLVRYTPAAVTTAVTAATNSSSLRRAVARLDGGALVNLSNGIAEELREHPERSSRRCRAQVPHSWKLLVTAHRLVADSGYVSDSRGRPALLAQLGHKGLPLLRRQMPVRPPPHGSEPRGSPSSAPTRGRGGGFFGA